MRWQRGFGWFMLAAIPAMITMWGAFGCSSGGAPPEIKFSPQTQFPVVGSELPIEIQATGKEGKPLAEGASISVSTSRGSFDKTTAVVEKTFKTNNEGKVSFVLYTGKDAGTALITARSEFATGTLSLIIQDNTTEPVSEPKPEKVSESVKDAGPGNDAPEVENNPFAALTIEVTARKTKLKADGKDFTEITARIKEPVLDAKDLEKIKLVFRTTLGTLLSLEQKPLPKAPGTTDGYEVPFFRGTFKALLRSGVRAGTAIVEAGINDSRYEGEARVQVNVVELGFLEFQEIKPDTLGTQGSGREVTTVSVKVLDTNNDPFPEGTRVYFEADGKASVTTAEALTNSKGIASTQVKSGSDVGTVVVRALVVIEVDHTISGCPAKCNSDLDCNACGYTCHLGQCKKAISARSQSIAIVGGRPSYRGMTFSCDARNVGALAGRIGDNIVTTVHTNCTVKLSDRYTNKVGFATQVIFMTEAGAIDPSAATQAGSNGPDIGTVTVSVRTQNPPPVDVEPMSVPNTNNCKDPQCTQPQNNGYWMPYNCTTASGLPKTLYVEPWYTDEFGRVRNPRDGLVTIVAYTNGEEQFTDTNKNGRYDVGEPFIDLGEPYLDVNDNGKWDARLPGLPNGEPFVDIPCTEQEAKNGTNGCKQAGVGNGRRDGPNGLWDESTVIWKKTWILWTGCQSSGADPTKINPAVNLRSCTQIPFQPGMFVYEPDPQKPGLVSSEPKDSYKLGNYKPVTTSTTFKVSPTSEPKFKFLWLDENLNPLTPKSTAQISAKGVTLSQIPAGTSLGTNNITEFGFLAYTLQQPTSGSAFVEELLVRPFSFYGTLHPRLYSHHISLIDSDQKLASVDAPASVSIDITVDTGATSGTKTCVHSYGIVGTTR